jgi:hypothetical protein
MGNPAGARRREFHPLELTPALARAARRHRAMAANPVIKLRGNRAHTQTTVLDQLKKSQQNRATAFGSCSCQIAGVFFLWACGIYRFSSSAGCVNLLPSDLISLSFSTERAQGHFLSPWSKSGALYAKEPR